MRSSSTSIAKRWTSFTTRPVAHDGNAVAWESSAADIGSPLRVNVSGPNWTRSRGLHCMLEPSYGALRMSTVPNDWNGVCIRHAACRSQYRLDECPRRPASSTARMAAFQAKYTPDQREAIASAVIDRGASAPRVVELAAAGQLTDSNGAQLEPFTVPANTVRSEARKAKKRRQGKAASDLGKAEPRDAVEALRRRIVTMLDEELGVEERKRKGNRDPERVRQICRAMREAAAIPGLKEPAKTAPG